MDFSDQTERVMSFTTEVRTDILATWIGNGLRFAAREEAEAHALHLKKGALSVRDSRIVETDDPVSHRFIDGKLIPIGVEHFTVTEETRPTFVVRGVQYFSETHVARPVVVTTNSRAEAEAYVRMKLGGTVVDESQ
jgi:hypothetical protein